MGNGVDLVRPALGFHILGAIGVAIFLEGGELRDDGFCDTGLSVVAFTRFSALAAGMVSRSVKAVLA